MLDQHKIIFQEVLDDADMAALEEQPEATLYSDEINNWGQNSYYAWVLYGAASYMCAIYWIQRYYFGNWYGTQDEYLSGRPSWFTFFGMGESLNRLILIGGWSFTAIAWSISLFQNNGIYMFFVMWARILHYIDIARIVITTIFKIIGMAQDRQEDYLIEDGLALDDGAVYAVTMQQSTDGTDWYMESFGLTVSFSLFGDLLGIAKQVNAKKEIENMEEQLDLNDEEEAEVDADVEGVDAFYNSF